MMSSWVFVLILDQTKKPFFQIMETKLKFLFDIRELLQQWGFSNSQAHTVNIIFGIFFIILLAFLSDIITRKVIIMIITRLVARTKTIWDDILLEKKVFNRLSHLAPGLVLWHSVGYVLSHYPLVMSITQKALTIYMIIVILLAVNAFLKGVNEIYHTLPSSHGRSIKGFVQVAQIIFFSLAIILIISTLSGTPPRVLMTGLGALAAVLLLIFRDTILGLVAGIQLSANDMVRIGDWITMSKYGADGNVMEITLNTVKVRNFDKTITTLPTYALVSDSFINWRGTEEFGARRFKKFININMKSVKFCDEELLSHLSRIKALKDFSDKTGSGKEKRGESGVMLHEGEVTNLTLFRKYVIGLLKTHPGLNQKLPMVVRQLQPAESGIPLEITAFSKGTESLLYEELQSDLFDHLLAVLPEFNLSVFQNPTGEIFK
jgi:miniconductance mechanosensitive channel